MYTNQQSRQEDKTHTRLIRAWNLPDSDVRLNAIHSGGAGGQNVNKVATGIHLRLDIMKSSLPDEIKKRLAALRFIDRRITMGRVIVIKATRFRAQERNRADAMERLDDLLLKAQQPQKLRHPTRPTLASIRKRLDDKLWHGRKKELRKKIKDWD